MNKVFLFIILIYSIVSCNNSHNENLKNEDISLYKERKVLKETDLLTFRLDTLTSMQSIISIYTSQIADKTYFSIINTYDNSWIYYDTNNGEIYSKQKLNFEGPNGVGQLNTFSGHYMKSKDSLYLYSSANSSIYLLDGKGNVLNKKNLLIREENDIIKSPLINAYNPLHFNNGNIYITNIVRPLSTYSKEKIILKMNANFENNDYIIAFPEIYDYKFWGNAFNYAPSIVGGKNKNNIVSFPIDEKVYITNEKGDILKYGLATSKHFDNITPMDVEKGYSLDIDNRDYAKEDSYSFSTSNYCQIIYDTYRDVYYRITHIRPSIEEVLLGNTIPDLSIIILDSNLNKVGETEVLDGKKYQTSMITVFKKGLGIARNDLYTENDSELTFSIFKIEEIDE